VTHCVWHFHY